MRDRIEELLNEIETFTASNLQHVEEFRIKLLSKKGKVKELFEEFKTVAPELRKEVGIKLNELQNKAQEKINQLKDKYEQADTSQDKKIDLTLLVIHYRLCATRSLKFFRASDLLFLMVRKLKMTGIISLH